MTVDLVVYGDGEAALRSVLLQRLPALGLAGVPVVTQKPANRPPRMVYLFRSGGPAETLVTEQGIYTVEAYAPTEQDAIELLMGVRAIILSLTGHLFGAEEFGGPANLPDPETYAVRYTATFNVRARPARVVRTI